MNSSEHRKGIVAIFLAAVLWSTGGVFIKLSSLDAFGISCLRSAFATLTFAFIFRRSVLNFNALTAFNALCYSALLILFVSSVKLTTVANAIFLQFTAPIYVMILEPILFKTRYERINILATIACFGGMALFFVGNLSPGQFTGNMLALLSGVAFAAFLLGQRKNPKEYHSSAIFWGNALIALVSLPLFLQNPNITSTDFLMVSYLGIIQIGLAYAVFTYGFQRVLAVESALIAMAEPVLNPVWTMIGYGEIPSPFAIAGGIIILLTIATRTIIVESRRTYKAEHRL